LLEPDEKPLNGFEAPAFGVELNMSEGCVLEVDAGGSCDLPAWSEKPPKPPDGAAVEVVGCCAEVDCPKVVKRFLESCGGLTKRPDPLLPPELVLGGGPAGVVELPKRFGFGLLVGVVLDVWPAVDVFEPRLPKEKPAPVLAPPPNKLDV